MRRLSRTALAGLLAAVPAACGGPPPAPDVVAQIDGEEVRYAEFEAYVAASLGEPEEPVLGSDVLSSLFDQFLDERLLVRLAVERQLAAPGASPRQASQALLAELLEEPIAESEVAAYYGEHRQEFELSERVRLRQMLFQERAQAESALARIAAGASFEEVGSSLGEDAGVSYAADQGELGRDDLPPAFVDTIFGLEPGEVSGIVAADYGFHLFQVAERSGEALLSLDAAAPRIREELRRERADRALERLVQEARSRYNARVHVRNLPFNYEGLLR